MSRSNFHETFGGIIVLQNGDGEMPDLSEPRGASHSMQKSANAMSIFGLKDKNKNESSIEHSR